MDTSGSSEGATAGSCFVNDENMDYGKLQPYSPPIWIRKLLQHDFPTCRVQLAMTPTPIHKWNLPGVPQNFQVYIKRDDMTGCTLSGNKVRKLEFIFGHILQNGYKHVISCGRMQSNYCRALALISAQLGIRSHLFLIEGDDGTNTSEKINATGNMFLSRMCDASIYLLPKGTTLTDVLRRQRDMTNEIFQKTGEKACGVYAGGSDFNGLFGYLQAWKEMMEQGVLENFDDVVVTCGSGGTLSGLAIGNYLTGQNLKVHGVSIALLAPDSYFHDHIEKYLAKLGLDGVKSKDIVDIIEGYAGPGYGLFTDDDINLYKTIASETGIVVDQGYVGKGVKGLISELTANPDRFKGNRILFVHTGGIFKLFDGKLADVFSDDKIYNCSDVAKCAGEF